MQLWEALADFFSVMEKGRVFLAMQKIVEHILHSSR
jgi:hypothetical protein